MKINTLVNQNPKVIIYKLKINKWNAVFIKLWIMFAVANSNEDWERNIIFGVARITN